MKKRIPLVALTAAVILLASCAFIYKNVPEGPPSETVSVTAPAVSESPAASPAPGPPESIVFYPSQPASEDAEDYYIIDSNGRQGVIDGNGKTVLPVEFESVEILKYGNSPTVFFTIDGTTHFPGKSSDSNGGLYDTSGKKIAAFDYEYAEALSDSIIFVTDGSSSGAVSFDGKQVVPCEYDEAFFCNGLIVAASADVPEDTGNTGYTDEDDEDEDYADYSYTKQNVYIYSIGGKMLRSKVINLKMYDSEEYYPDEYAYYDDKYIYVSDDSGDKCGVMDTSFNQLIPPAWDDISAAGANTFIVAKNMGGPDNEDLKYGVINIKGETVLQVIYDDIKIAHENGETGDVLLCASSADGAYIFDKTGKQIYYSNKYTSVTLENGFKVVTDGNNMMHALDKNENDLFPPAQYIEWNDKSRLYECGSAYSEFDFYGDSVVSCYTSEGVKISVPGLTINYPVSPDRFVGEETVNGKPMRVLYGADGKVFAELDYITGNYGNKLLYAYSGNFSGYIDLNGKWVWRTSEYDTLMD